MATLLDWQLGSRHCCEEEASVSLGQLVELPLHVSAGSHTPALSRHSVPALPAGCWHSLLLPSHSSSEQVSPSSLQAVPSSFLMSGQLELPSTQTSARSHSPDAAPHDVPP
jgi:hypothetical protein